MSIGLEANAAVVGEGLPIPVQGLPWNDPIAINPEKVAAALVLTNELWQNTSAAGQPFVNPQLRAAISAACDRFPFSKLRKDGPFDAELTTTGRFPDPDAFRAALLTALNRVNTRAASNLLRAVPQDEGQGMTHRRKLCAVIAILQGHPLVDEANCDPAKLFALGRYSTDSLEVAVQLATKVLNVLKKVEG